MAAASAGNAVSGRDFVGGYAPSAGGTFTAVAALAAAVAARGRRALERSAWLLLEPFLPGATLFLLLVVLTSRYLRQGFHAVRQHAYAPDGGKWTLNATTRRQWWQCPCGSLLACRCVRVVTAAMREGAGRWLEALCAGCRTA